MHNNKINTYENIIGPFLYEDKNVQSTWIGKNVPKTKPKNILPEKY